MRPSHAVWAGHVGRHAWDSGSGRPRCNLQVLLLRRMLHAWVHLADRVRWAGHMLFQGPCKEVMPFFQGLGFDIPERKGIPDFMQEVSGLRDQQVWPCCLGENYGLHARAQALLGGLAIVAPDLGARCAVDCRSSGG